MRLPGAVCRRGWDDMLRISVCVIKGSNGSEGAAEKLVGRLAGGGGSSIPTPDSRTAIYMLS